MVKIIGSFSNNNSVASIVSTLIANHVLDPATEQVRGLSLALIAPLGADEHDCRHQSQPFFSTAAFSE